MNHAVLPKQHLLDVSRARHHRHDDIRLRGKRCRCLARGRAGRHQRVGCSRPPCPHAKLMPALEDVPRHASSHDTETDESDSHSTQPAAG